MNFRSVLCLLMMSGLLFGQMTIVSTQPAANALNVPTSTTISITFSEAIDTNFLNLYGEDFMFTNIDSITSQGYSTDAKTMFATAVLKSNTTYFFSVMFMKSTSGATLTVPSVIYFCTGSAFPPFSVSGTVLSGSTGISPEGAIVGLSSINIMQDNKEGGPPFIGWALVNANGTYTVPYLTNGTYWPIAAKDVDHDGRINPDYGVDGIAFRDSIIVNNASLTGIDLTFINFSPKTFHEIITTADSLAKTLPADRQLKRISAWEVDSLGRSTSWEFAYGINGNTEGKAISIHTFSSNIYTLDPGYFEWLAQLKPITSLNNIATSAVVISNAENAGGREIRQQPHPDSVQFRIELGISDQKFGWFGGHQIDTNKIYWAAVYAHHYQISQNESQWLDGKMFLCDLQTGVVLLTQNIMDVRGSTAPPLEFTLQQNYPNPFNPATMIEFSIRAAGYARLTVYDMLGKEIAVLAEGMMKPGEYSVRFAGDRLPSGMYFYQLRSGNAVQTKRMVLLK